MKKFSNRPVCFSFYDQKHFQGQNVLTVRADDEEVGGLLKRLFADKNVEFVFEDQTVIVRPAVSRKQVNGKVVKGSSEMLPAMYFPE